MQAFRGTSECSKGCLRVSTSNSSNSGHVGRLCSSGVVHSSRAFAFPTGELFQGCAQRMEDVAGPERDTVPTQPETPCPDPRVHSSGQMALDGCPSHQWSMKNTLVIVGTLGCDSDVLRISHC